MVVSHSGQWPHLVIPGKGGQFKCDEHCLNYKSLGICSHTVAVAHVNNQLNKFLLWFQKTKRRPNITSLSTHSMPPGRGKKGNQQSHKRAPKEPIVNWVDQLQNELYLGSSANEFTLSDSGTNIFTSYYCTNPYSNSFNMPFTYKPSVAPHSMPARFLPPLLMAEAPLLSEEQSPFRLTPSLTMAEEQSPFRLWFISGNISKCAGCNNKYSKPAIPPFDLCIQHKEWRTFIPTPGGESQSKFAPAYYHLNLLYINRNWPMFIPSWLSVGDEVRSKMSPLHWEYLKKQGF